MCRSTQMGETQLKALEYVTKNEEVKMNLRPLFLKELKMII